MLRSKYYPHTTKEAAGELDAINVMAYDYYWQVVWDF